MCRPYKTIMSLEFASEGSWHEQVRGRGTISTFHKAAGGTDLWLVNHALSRHSALNFMCVVLLKHCRLTG